jgi:AcrR family transcriptional regulator
MASTDGTKRGDEPPRADARRNRAKILAAAEEVFAERGPAGSTEEVARRAGVAIGTVFRHFPTKQALLQAIVKDLLTRLGTEADNLATRGDPATGLFGFFTSLVDEAAAKKSVIDLLGDLGTAVPIDGPVRGLAQAVGALLANAQHAGTVRDDVTLDDVTALLVSTTQGALRAGWPPALRGRVLGIVFDGLAPRHE